MAGLRIGVALSREADGAVAARDSAVRALREAGLSSASWALCFFSAAHMNQAQMLREVILEETGCTALAGCSSAGVIGEGQEVEAGPALALMVGDNAQLSARSALLPEDGEGLEGFADLASPPDNGLLIALPDAFQVDAERMCSRMGNIVPHMSVFGAGAIADGRGSISLQMGLEGVHNRSISVLSLRGGLGHAVGITQSCTQIDDPRFITAAKESVLVELDGKNALDTLIEVGKNLDLKDFQQLVEEVLFGFPLDWENPSFSGETCLVRPLGGLDQETHGLVIPFLLREQGSVAFMHRNPDNAERDIRRMAQSLKERLPSPPDAGIYFDCAGRGSRFYGKPDVDVRTISRELGEFPLIGMQGGFELATRRGWPYIYTFTGVLVLLYGKDANQKGGDSGSL